MKELIHFEATLKHISDPNVFRVRSYIDLSIQE